MSLSETLTSVAHEITNESTSEQIDPREKLKEAGFSDENISSLGEELLTRFAESFPIYARGVEGNLALREVLSNSSTEEFKSSVEDFVETHRPERSSIEAAQDKVMDVVESGMSQIENWGESKVKNALGGLGNIPIIGDWLSEKLFSEIKESYETGKKNLWVFILGLFPFGKNLISGYENFRSNTQRTTGEDSQNTTPEIAIEETINAEDDAPQETLSDTIEIEKRNKTEVGGYMLLSQLAGFPIEKNSPQVGILGEIDKQNITLIEMRGYLLQGNLKEQFGMENTEYEEADILQVVIGITGPINEEFFKDQLDKDSIKAIIGTTPNYNDVGNTYFTKEERESIEQNNFQYEKCSIGILSRLSLLALRHKITLVTSLPGEYAQKLTNLFGDIIEDNDISQSLSQSASYPRGVSLAFESNLGENISHNAEFFIENAETKLSESGEILSREEKEMIRSIVAYKEIILQGIERFSLETHGFSENIRSRMSWGNILVLYGLLKGENLDTASGFDEVCIYAWVYGILDGTTRGNYNTQIVKKLLEEKDENQSKILTVLILRIAEIDRNVFLESISQAKGSLDGTVGWITGFNEIEDDNIRNILINLSEIGGFALAMKILNKTPIFRAVMIASTGVIGTSIILGIKEKIYADQSSEIAQYYRNFLQEVSPYMGYENNYEALIADVESGNLGTSEIFSRAANAPQEMLEGIIGKLFPNAT